MDTKKLRFAEQSVLTPVTPVLGSTAGAWHQALTDGWQADMDDLAKKIAALPPPKSSGE